MAFSVTITFEKWTKLTGSIYLASTTNAEGTFLDDKYKFSSNSSVITSTFCSILKCLINSLKEKNEEFSDMSFGDFGCGNGYFLKSLQNYGIKKIKGYEVSDTFVKNGNILLGNEIIEKIDINNYLNVVKDVNVLSLVGVLEHIRHPREFLSNLKKIKGLRYLYISVPTHSFSSYLETFSQNHWSRLLGNGHTHLYTDNSLKHIEKEFGLERISEWWFGTDMLDLFRHLTLDFEQKGLSQEFKNYFIELIDGLQLEIDKQKKSSEAHVLYKIM